MNPPPSDFAPLDLAVVREPAQGLVDWHAKLTSEVDPDEYAQFLVAYRRSGLPPAVLNDASAFERIAGEFATYGVALRMAHEVLNFLEERRYGNTDGPHDLRSKWGYALYELMRLDVAHDWDPRQFGGWPPVYDRPPRVNLEGHAYTGTFPELAAQRTASVDTMTGELVRREVPHVLRARWAKLNPFAVEWVAVPDDSLESVEIRTPWGAYTAADLDAWVALQPGATQAPVHSPTVGDEEAYMLYLEDLEEHREDVYRYVLDLDRDGHLTQPYDLEDSLTPAGRDPGCATEHCSFCRPEGHGNGREIVQEVPCSSPEHNHADDDSEFPSCRGCACAATDHDWHEAHVTLGYDDPRVAAALVTYPRTPARWRPTLKRLAMTPSNLDHRR